MRLYHLGVAGVMALLAAGCAAPGDGGGEKPMVEKSKSAAGERPAMPPLTEDEKHILQEKGTEPPFTGKYTNHFERGVYVCRQCGAPLYLSDSKFASECGWPSFDDEIRGAVKRQPDADGRRTEILCAGCGGHLGHVFTGEKFTEKDTRHCVNSASLVFIPQNQRPPGRALLAGGCFWGVQHYLGQAPGVLSVRSGYSGGHTEKPTYEEVCSGKTGHAEAVEVIFDPKRITYEQLAKLFFEIHDPTQVNRQGPDVGTQYRSAVFYHTPEQRDAAQAYKEKLEKSGKYKRPMATEITPAGEFWRAEEYHQRYLEKRGLESCKTH